MIEIQTGPDLSVVCRRSGDLDLTSDAVENVMSLLFVCPLCASRQLAEPPVESSTPPEMTLAEWRYRKLAA
jgi:hypothetical protein